MIEWVYPTVAVLSMYLLVVPTLTLMSRLALQLGNRFTHVHEWGAGWVWFALVAPVLLPVLWFSVDAFHQIDGHHAIEACVTPHADGGCAESVVLAFLVMVPLAWRAFRVSTARPSGTRFYPTEPRLRRARIFVDPEAAAPVSTHGLIFPWIALRPDAIATLTPSQLNMALLHEAAHARNLDPLRRATAAAALAMNPMGYLLKPFFSRWELGREASCDLAAAHCGNRFELAEALVHVARMPSRQTACCSLLVGSSEALVLRVSILVHDVLPGLRKDSVRWAVAVALFVLAMQVAVHEVLHHVHVWSERGFLWLMA